MATQKTFTKNQINDQIESVLADNTSQAISAADVRSVVKDYMTESMSAPLLIYAGIWREKTNNSGSNPDPDIPSYVKDQYYNPDFFQFQNVNDPTNTSNIYQADTTSIPGVNGQISLKSNNEFGLEITINVTNGLLGSMTIQEPGTGFVVGSTISLFNTNNTSFTALTLTYNGAVRPISENSNARFDLTSNSDNSYSAHNTRNTILSATPLDTVGYKVTGNNSSRETYFGGISFDGNNRLKCRNALISTLSGESHKTYVQIYRIPAKI
tara:strand:+ start:2614 stop:3417 length:804 start_codon:yes stop_codon:yes gene_type:complete